MCCLNMCCLDYLLCCFFPFTYFKNSYKYCNKFRKLWNKFIITLLYKTLLTTMFSYNFIHCRLLSQILSGWPVTWKSGKTWKSQEKKNWSGKSGKIQGISSFFSKSGKITAFSNLTRNRNLFPVTTSF